MKQILKNGFSFRVKFVFFQIVWLQRPLGGRHILDPRAHVSPRQRVTEKPDIQTCAEGNSSGVEIATRRPWVRGCNVWRMRMNSLPVGKLGLGRVRLATSLRSITTKKKPFWFDLSAMDWRIYCSSFISFFFTLIHVSNSKFSTEKCIELGLSANLLCSSCDALEQFKLGALVENCRSCCHADGDDGSSAKVKQTSSMNLGWR